jgi:hypothetical protein
MIHLRKYLNLEIVILKYPSVQLAQSLNRCLQDLREFDMSSSESLMYILGGEFPIFWPSAFWITGNARISRTLMLGGFSLRGEPGGKASA